jgi:dipeptidyl-peptidase-4
MKEQANKQIHFLIGLLTVLCFVSPSYSKGKQELLTVAESSQFKATSKHLEVMDFIHALQRLSPNIRVETLCTSTEGREIPLMIIGDPVPFPQKRIKHGQKLVIYIQANIHAGEVEGKEASLMLARDLLLTDKSSYLDSLVVLIAPNFNADGNEKISPANRRNQAGPEDGVGLRHNGQNLDLNREGMKLESPEVLGMVQNVLIPWDPALFIDLHTHNGSYHEEPVTFIWNLNPNGDISIVEYMRDRFYPAVKQIMREEYGILIIPHGDFRDPRDPEKGWTASAPEPRYLTNYVGLRNRMAILNENYPYVDYKTRVLGCYDLLCACLDYCSAHREEIVELLQKADMKTVLRGMRPTPDDQFHLDFELKALEDKIAIKGYEMEIVELGDQRPRVKRTDKMKTYHVPFFTDYVPTNSVPFPHGYLVQPPVPEVLEKLLQHGICVERLTSSTTLEVQTFKIQEVKPAARLFQGHYLNSISGEYSFQEITFPPGTLFVGNAQPLANVAAYLLEPESDDGLLAWNYFDRYIVAQWGQRGQIYPVYKLLKPAALVKETVFW